MSWHDWALAGLVVFGAVLFLYGSKYYDNIVGWMGVFLAVCGFLVLILLYLYRALRQRKDQKASSESIKPTILLSKIR